MSLGVQVRALFFLLLQLAFPGSAQAAEPTEVPPCAPAQAGEYHIQATIQRDSHSFTEGLAIAGPNQLYESSGGYGESRLLLLNREDFAVVRTMPIDPAYFGEGVTRLGERLYLLTWKEGLILTFDSSTLDFLESRPFAFEGWGLTQDGRDLIASDGSPTIHYLDPESLEVKKNLQVRDEAGPVDRINELEYVDGSLYANIFQSDRIVRIDPDSGCITRFWNFSALLPPEEKAQLTSEQVLNGIAFDPDKRTFLLTGKDWPKAFEVNLR